MRDYLWKSGQWLPSYAPKIILGLFAPNLYMAQHAQGSKFSIKKSSLVYMKFWIKSGVFCVNLTRGCQVMPQKPFWANLPQIHLLDPSPCVTKFSKRKTGKVLFIKFWTNWGVICENLASGCQVMPKT